MKEERKRRNRRRIGRLGKEKKNAKKRRGLGREDDWEEGEIGRGEY
jgi:hypothetical protein